ncbi:MAG: hypothetical protein ACYTFY_10505 [Planctomycetota bacterium]
MVVQCRMCKKIRDNGEFRFAWPGELPLEINNTYCPECAEKTLTDIQKGKRPFMYERLNTNAAS